MYIAATYKSGNDTTFGKTAYKKQGVKDNLRLNIYRILKSKKSLSYKWAAGICRRCINLRTGE